MRPDSGEDRGRPPDREQDPDHREKHHPTGTKLRILDTSGRLPTTVSPPGQTVPDQQSQAQSQHELGEETLEVEDVAHGVATVTPDSVES